MRAAQSIDHALRPFEVLGAGAARPVGRRIVGHVAHIADLVRQLDQLRPVGQVRRVLDLQLLAPLARQRLVVGALRGRCRRSSLPKRASSSSNVVCVSSTVSCRIAAHSTAMSVDAALVDEHVGERDRMIDVGRRGDVLAPLVAMLVRGEGERIDEGGCDGSGQRCRVDAAGSASDRGALAAISGALRRAASTLHGPGPAAAMYRNTKQNMYREFAAIERSASNTSGLRDR